MCLGSHGKCPYHMGGILIRENWILASKVMTWGKVGTAKNNHVFLLAGNSKNSPKLHLEP